MPNIATKPFRERYVSQKAHYDTYWRDKHREESHYIMPERGRFDDEENAPNDGKKRFAKVIDHTTGIAAQKLGAGLLDGLSPPNRDWIKLELEDKALMELRSVKEWLTHSTDMIKETFQNTNFYNAAGDVYEEVATFGFGNMLIDSDPIDVVRFYSFTCGTYYFAMNPRGVVDRVYRRFSDTVRNVVDEFGIDNVSSRVKLIFDSPTDRGGEYVNLIQVIEPNKDRDRSKDDNLNMPFISVYMEADGTNEEPALRVSGYHEFPSIVPRYRTVADEAYGQSPAERALGPTKSLQDIEADFLRASKKTIDPMLNVPTDMKKVRRGAGAVNLYDGAAGAPIIQAAYQVNYDFNSNLLASEKKREAINKIMNTELFTAISGLETTGRTATEINQRVAEVVKLLVAVISRLNSEFLRPTVERTFNMLVRAGRIREAPPEIPEGANVKVVFISALAQAQQAVGMTNIEQLLDFTARAMQVDPSAAKKFNGPQAVDEMGLMSGAPRSLIRTDEEVAAMEAAEKELAQQERTAASLSQMAEGAEKLGNTPMDQNTALDKVVQGGQLG